MLWSVAGVMVAATVVTGAVLADGYDEQEVPRIETGVWVTRDDGRYARVNTQLGEIDTVRAVADPAGVVQSGANSVVLTQGYANAWPVNAAVPVDLVDGEADATSATLSSSTPAGTEQVMTASDAVVYLTSVGEVYLGTYPGIGEPMPDPWLVDPYAGAELVEGEDPPVYVADAVAIDDDGTVAMYSIAEAAIREYDTTTGTFVGEPVAVPDAPASDAELALTFADGTWVLFDSASAQVWAEGAVAPFSIDAGDDAAIQSTPSHDAHAWIADGTGLLRVDVEAGEGTRVAEASGAPTAPVVVDGEAYAAWITTGSAALWSTARDGVTDLEIDAAAFADVQAVAPVFRTNGDRAVLSETATGSLWTLPEGTLVPASQWDAVEDTDEVLGERTVDDVVEQEPPVAVDDAFGVRPGALVSLPLLYNDHDPNSKDVLTVDPASVTALSDAEFGEVSLVAQDQQAAVRVRAESGSATFTYAVTDGFAVSAPASVTLTVVPDDINTAPVWCGVDACTQEWPRPQVSPGGYAEVPVLRGWVDPEGDPVVLTDARADDADALVTVVPTEDGKVAIRHLDPNAADAVIPITVTVTDGRGETATRTLELQVTGAPSLEVEPVAVSGALNEVSQVEIADFVSGGSGSYRLVDAVVSQGGDTVTVTPIGANSTVELTATAPGRYLATYTVEDTSTLAQATGTLRYTVTEGARPLAVPPLTAFVRAQEDATVDVLAAVQNTTGRVLMVAEATSNEPALSASVVGTSYVRVSGTTEDGEPGVVGTAEVVIADGAGNTASTQLTVFLLPPAEGLSPIAMPDTVTVRAGAQVDVPVLANDTGPRGERLMLMADVEGSGQAGELAFGSGKMLRYLAPQTPGVYTLRYHTYIESDVERTDSATVTVDVLPAGSNRSPEPSTLTARVLVGKTVRIPFDAVGVDPDGDAVTLVDVSQPGAAQGTATVSATGAAILYKAPQAAVTGGQVSFTYTVVDALGERATGTVRVGVLDSTSADVAPVTYSDYLSAQVDSETAIPVEPLLNDSDPLQGELRVLDVQPNAAPGSAEFERLEALFDRAAFEADGSIAMLPGSVAGTHSYIYTVESPVSMSTAEGRIVVDVSEAANPPSLRIQDTVLTARTRHDLATGIDVVTGKVQWQGGDVSGLRLSLWDDTQTDMKVSGWTISGTLPSTRTVIPFTLTGTDYSGEEVTSHGFLRIPEVDDMRLQLLATASAVEVGEEESVEFDVKDLLDVTGADVIEVRQDDSYDVQRTNARCVPTGNSTVSYAAGREAPWADTCSVAVKLRSQDTWSVVAVPLSIIPKDPQAILNPISLTISPNLDDTVNLVEQLVTWEGGRVGDVSDLNLQTSYSGDAFIVSTSGGVLTARAHADAVPGTREVVQVRSAAFGGLSTTVTLVVGAAVPDNPRGATFSRTCDVSVGSSCTIAVVDVAGEYDPYAGAERSGLTLTRVGSSGTTACSVATVTQASETSVVATWPGGQRPEGGECIVNFTVKDVQGRTGTGTLTIDVQGYPKPPAAVTTVGYTGSSVTLEVALGPAAQAHPSVTSVTVVRSGSPVAADCAPAGSGTYRCTISGLENGQAATYTARAVNSVGESLDSSAHTTWAYQAPKIESVTAVPVYRAGVTSANSGVVEVSITSSADTRAFQVGDANQEKQRQGNVTTFEMTLPVGAQNLRVVPLSQFQPPTTGSAQGDTKYASVTVAGAPRYDSSISVEADGTTVTVTGGALNTNSSALPTSQIWYAWTTSQPECVMDSAGRAALRGGSYVQSAAPTITGLDEYTTYNVAVCGSNGYGAVKSNSTSAYTWVSPVPPENGITYQVSNSWNFDGDRTYEVKLMNPPNPSSKWGLNVFYRYDGANKSQQFTLGADTVRTIEVGYCSWMDPDRCGDWTEVSPASGSPRTPATVTFPEAPGVRYDDGTTQWGCFPEGTLDPNAVSITGAARGAATVTVEASAFVVTWSGTDFGGLPTITHAVTICDPPPEPEPTPDPTPTPTPDPTVTP